MTNKDVRKQCDILECDNSICIIGKLKCCFCHRVW